MKNKGVRRSLFILFWVGFLLFVYISNKTPKGISIVFDIAILQSKSDKNSGNLYLDTGKGYNESEVKEIYYSQDNTQFEHYSFELPFNIKRLRIDPLQTGGIVEIRNIKVRKYMDIKTGDGKDALIPIHAIGRILEPQNGVIRVEMLDNDPYLEFSKEFFEYSWFDFSKYVLSHDADKLIAGFSFLLLFPILLLVVMSEK